jgi:hypothetical protein
MKRYPILAILLGMSVALVLAMTIIVQALHPPTEDVWLLTVFMAGSGTLTVLLAFLLYRRGLARWFPSLSWALLTTVILTIVLVLINVWVTAQLMFISKHDLTLNMALLLFAGLTAFFFGLF